MPHPLDNSRFVWYNLIHNISIRYIEEDRMNAANPLARRKTIAQKAPRIEQVMKGSIVMMKRYCGKPNCRCRRGFKHRSMYVSQTIGGRSRLVYIPKRSEENIRRLTVNYRRLKTALQKISSANMSIATRAI
jgi:hypothetical protein